MTQPEPVVRRHADHDPELVCRPALGYGLCEVLGDEERSDEMGPAATCPVAFVPRDPEYCPRCTCDQPAGHQGHHHCPDCEVWYTLASDVERAS